MSILISDYLFGGLELLVKKLIICYDLIKVPKVLSQRMRECVYKRMGASIIYIPISYPSLCFLQVFFLFLSI